MPPLLVPSNATPQTHFDIRTILSWRQFSRNIFVFTTLSAFCLSAYQRDMHLQRCLSLPGKRKARYLLVPMLPGRYWGIKPHSPAPSASRSHVCTCPCPRTGAFVKCAFSFPGCKGSISPLVTLLLVPLGPTWGCASVCFSWNLLARHGNG